MNTNCLFCKVVKGEIPSKAAYSNDKIVAFHDINPQAPTHILICPTKHISSLSKASDEDREIFGEIQIAARNLAKEFNLEGFRLVLNNGRTAGQSVDHVHYHLLGGRRFSWPPG